MELKDIVKEYKHRYHLTNKEIADHFHVTHITVGRWLRGEVKTIQEETAQNMSKVLGYDVQAVLQGTAVDMKKPILGMAKAGYDMFLDDNYLGEEIVSLQEYHDGDYFLRVCGNSMIYSGIKDGGLVYVKQCNSVENGEIAVVRIADEVTIKKYYKQKNDILLEASNPDVPNKEFTFQQAHELPVKIIGKVLFSKNYM